MRKNRVNEAAAVPERQVLPAVLDHGRDLALLAAGAADVEIWTLILDWANAFMGVPLAPGERPFNLCVLEAPARRDKPPLYDGEPREGTVVAWRVLGFGGRPNPHRLLEGGFVCGPHRAWAS